MKRSGWRRAPLVATCALALMGAGMLRAAGDTAARTPLHPEGLPGPASAASAPLAASLLPFQDIPPAQVPTLDPTAPGDTGAAALQETASGVGAGAPPVDTGAVVPQQGAAGDALARARTEVDTPWHARLVSVLGMFVLVGIGWLLSVDRTRVPWRVIAWGVGLQLVFGVIILKTVVGEALFAAVNGAVVALLGYTVQGASFIFGNLVWNNVPVGAGEALGNAPVAAVPGTVAATGAFFAFNVLPTIIFFSSLMTLLYHFGVMQLAVKGMAWVMMRTMKTSGAETLSAAGNIFLGQTEAPLVIKPYVEDMTRSELMAVMTGGFATVAGGVMAAYVGMLVFYFPDIAGHLMAASVMSAPAALLFAKLMVPETGVPRTASTMGETVRSGDANAVDAAARGAGEGLHLALNVGAMLLAFIALIALLNALIAGAADLIGLTGLLQGFGWLGETQRLTLEFILGWLLAPLVWVMGVPWADAVEVGSLLGIKTVVNEFVGYLQLAAMLQGGADLAPRSIIIATYALCGFANFSSIAIQIGGIGGIAPSRRQDLARLGLRAMVAGTLAAFMTATVAGLLV